jgi:hypothetical protein
MRLYSHEEEEQVHAQADVRAWARAGLIDARQAAALEDDVRPSLKRTNGLLRAGLALFTLLIVAAAVLLVRQVFSIWSDGPSAIVAGCAAAACLLLAEWLVASIRVYRYGVEEALAVAAVVLSAVCADEALSAVTGGGHRYTDAVMWLTVLAAGGAAIWRRYGFVYAAIGGLACAASIPFQVHATEASQRAVSALLLAAAFAGARATRGRCADDVRRSEYATLQVAAWVGVYLVLNLHLLDVLQPLALPIRAPAWFAWTTYVAIWLMPIAGLALAIRQRDRALLDANVVLAFATLATNKPYLGWPRQTWDPIVLGVLLIAVALALRRWLASGTHGERAGFTAAPILESQSVMAHVATASVAFTVSAPASSPSDSAFSGGRSGGGGGGGSY